MVRQGLFREDLFYRLSTIRIEIPPLRERGDDMDLLARHFVTVRNERFESSRTISEASLRILRTHRWPGNVREMLHSIEAAMVLCDGDEILPEHFPASILASVPAALPASQTESARMPTLEELERVHIKSVLQATNGHRGSAARMLGISERNLYRKLKEHQLLP